MFLVKLTTSFGLKKPEGSDVVNIDDFNYNADILDTKLKAVETQSNTNKTNITALQTTVNTNKTNITNNTNLANQALTKANEAFQRGDEVKGLLVDKLISEGLNVSTNNSFEELIGNIALGKKWASGVSITSSSTALFTNIAGTTAYPQNYFDIPILGFAPNHIIYIGTKSVDMTGYVTNLTQKTLTDGSKYINVFTGYTNTTKAINTYGCAFAGTVIQDGISMRIPCKGTSTSSSVNAEVAWIAFE